MGGKPRYKNQVNAKLYTPRGAMIHYQMPKVTEHQLLQLVIMLNRTMTDARSKLTWRQKGRKCSCGCFVWTVEAAKIVCDGCGKVMPNAK